MRYASVVLAVLAAPAAAARTCRGNLTVRMTGDLFMPVECSTATAVTAPLPADAPAAAKPDLAALKGEWEGDLSYGLSRYQAHASLKVGLWGKVETDLDLLEIMRGERVTHHLTLTPAKGAGRYALAASTSRLEDESLKGEALFGTGVSSSAASGEAQAQCDLRFVNGASHRVVYAPEGRNRLRLKVWSSIPGWPVRSFELVLRRSAHKR